MPASLDTIENLTRKQLQGLWLERHDGLHGTADAVKFLKSVGFALRYNATKGLPLASMYWAVWGGSEDEEETGAQRRATEITNDLLSSRVAVEVSVIADRLVLAHKSLVPAVYALIRRGRSGENVTGLSLDAARAYDFICQKVHASAGEVRKHLGVACSPRSDPALNALAELQRQMLVSRGASSVPEEGIPYLSKEGYPYFAFHVIHEDIVKSSCKLKLDQAAMTVLDAYLKPAAFSTSRKLTSLFKLCLSENEMRAALAGLLKKRKVRIQKVGRDELVIAK